MSSSHNIFTSGKKAIRKPSSNPFGGGNPFDVEDEVKASPVVISSVEDKSETQTILPIKLEPNPVPIKKSLAPVITAVAVGASLVVTGGLVIGIGLGLGVASLGILLPITLVLIVAGCGLIGFGLKKWHGDRRSYQRQVDAFITRNKSDFMVPTPVPYNRSQNSILARFGFTQPEFHPVPTQFELSPMTSPGASAVSSPLLITNTHQDPSLKACQDIGGKPSHTRAHRRHL